MISIFLKAYMKRAVFITKILSAISFLFLIAPNEKFLLPMWMFLVLSFYPGVMQIQYMFASLLLIAALFYLLLSGLKKYTTQRSNILSGISILILYVPVVMIFNSQFKHFHLLSFCTYVLFLIFSLITLGILSMRIKMNNTFHNKVQKGN